MVKRKEVSSTESLSLSCEHMFSIIIKYVSIKQLQATIFSYFSTSFNNFLIKISFSYKNVNNFIEMSKFEMTISL
jgi:hypothetical protein